MTFGLPQKNENKLDSATETLPCNRHGPNSIDTFLAIKERETFSIQGIRFTHISDRTYMYMDIYTSRTAERMHPLLQGFDYRNGRKLKSKITMTDDNVENTKLK